MQLGFTAAAFFVFAFGLAWMIDLAWGLVPGGLLAGIGLAALVSAIMAVWSLVDYMRELRKM